MTPDKFGFYQVGNRKTFSKFEALEWSKQSNVEVSWIFNDEAFSRFDWFTEPDIDLWELYKQRARQIRDKYDYCVLWYSGGSDSHNILMSWLDAGCKVDEIAVTWNYGLTGNLQNHQNAEIVNVVLPDVKKLKNSGYDFKFRLIEIPDVALKFFENTKNNHEYFFNYNIQLSSIGKQLIRDEVDDYKKLIDGGKKVCFVWGKDKPYVYNQNNKFYCTFADTIDDVVGPYSQQRRSQGWYDELFYWTSDMPSLPIKMAHVVKNYLKFAEDKSNFMNQPYLLNDSNYSPSLNMFLKAEKIKELLYPKWSNNIFCNGKSPRRILGLRDEWISKLDISKKETMSSVISNIFSLTEQTKPTAMKPFYSKKYWLE